MLKCARTTVKKGRPLPVALATRYLNVPDWIVSRVDGLPDWIVFLFQFKTYAALFISAAVATAIATPIFILLARRLDWMDRPLGRKRHAAATPTMGGLVIFAVVFIGAAVAMRLPNRVGEMLEEHSRSIYALLVCTACMLGLGIVDDRAGVRPRVKLLVQTVVAVAAIALGYRVEAITLPWVDSVVLPDAVGAVLSLLWIVGITNAINLADGLDGLAAGICFLASAVNAVVAVWLGNYYMAVMMLLLAGSLLGFLRWNFHPARVFLGDTGSLPTGMYLALCSLHSAQKAHTVVLILVPLFALGYPIFDTLLAVARRMFRGQPLFASDRDHIHHRLLDHGASHSAATIQIYVASILLCGVCLAAVAANHLALGLAITAILAMTVFSARFLGYLEWGGWITRWRGRSQTRLLHAAANLARLKIQQAGNPQQLLDGLGVFVAEIGCRHLAFTTGDPPAEWHGAASDAAPNYAMDMPLTDGAAITLVFDRADTIDVAQSQLLEELCAEAGERLLALNPSDSDADDHA